MTDFAHHIRAAGKRSIATFGDSITAGASVPEAARWANRLALQLGLELRNKGISGTILQGAPDANGLPRTDNGMARYHSDLLGEDRCDVVAILYGVNDARHTGAPDSINHAGFVRDYHLLLSALINAGFAGTDICIGNLAHITDAGFAVGDPEFTGRSRAGFNLYSDTIRALAREFGTYYAAVNETMLARGGDALVLPDHVHPNAAGHGAIAESFTRAIRLD